MEEFILNDSKNILKDLLTFTIPKTMEELATLKLPDPYLVDYYKRFVNREILWNDEINDNLVDIYQQILDWNKEDNSILPKDRTPIKIFINSDGGSLNAVMTIIDLIKLSKTPVMTIGLGKCFSSGGLLLMGGHKGLRYILPSCQILIHDGQTGAVGNVSKVMDNLEFTKESEERVKSYVIGQTNITDELYDKNYRRDWWIFAEEGISLGVADKIITDLDEII